ncbi:MAG TPA: thioredoxin domain-containing protein [Terriglobales bacterium]|nr:thioredoxin domain-containing protein [Terriglobales bacterium]
MPDQTNSLAQASSAYLRSAMHQPIRWYQWGEDAFAAAQRENKPMLLDIGAVWCHWCHVMDRESYDDPEVARIINENFIAMKVDRDERPDIDSRYQSAVQAMAGQGGWPLTAFLTPEGKPFYGGTYFPPDDQWGRPGFKRVLMAIADAFRGKRDEVLQQADMVLSSISQAESFAGRSASIPPTIVRSVIASALKTYDSEHGGFGSAPKFPHPSTMDLLIHLYSRSGDERLREVIANTLERMARGGVYDQLGGGFHRYSVDERWVVPHFEKMSYDNSELLKNYVHGYQATGNSLFAAVARDIIRWMDAWLSDRSEGGFYASQDADINLDDDGDYFTWTLEEARAALTEEELKVAQPYYDINEAGEMHHNPAKNVLFVHASVEEIGVRTGMQRDRISALLDAAKDKMYAARLKRATPFVDKTVYVGWNALCVSAYLEAARVLSLEDARHFALRSLDRILSHGFTAEGGLKHVIAYADPQAPKRNVAGVLDDYAFTALACLDGYEATADLSYFTFARKIVDAMIERLYDQTSGGFFDSENKAVLGALTARRKPFQDSPTPAGNSAAAIALFRMHAYTHEDSYREKAEDTLEVFAGMAEQYGMFAATYALAAVWLLEGHTQVVVVGNDERARELYAAAVAPFAVNKAVVKVSDSAAAPQNLPPVIAETVPNIPAVKDGKSTAVLCSNFTCRPPISDPDELAKVLHETLVAKAA